MKTVDLMDRQVMQAIQQMLPYAGPPVDPQVWRQIRQHIEQMHPQIEQFRQQFESLLRQQAALTLEVKA